MFHMENDIVEKITVCQKIFLPTLGLTTDKAIHTVLSKSESSWTISDVSDKWGKIIAGNKTSNNISEKVNGHILSFHPSISHYRRKYTPDRLYISPEFNLSMMHPNLCDSKLDDKVSYTYYYK